MRPCHKAAVADDDSSADDEDYVDDGGDQDSDFFIFIFSFLPSDWLGLITFITTEQNECRRVCADYTPRVRTLLNVQGGLSADIFVSVLPYFTKKVNFSIDKGSI